jgi:F0F1-type ATP synthase gamma subunit
MERMLASLGASVAGTPDAPKLLVGTGADRVHLLVVVTAERGLCGGFNTNVVRFARAQVRALEAAETSSKLALEANRLGYDVGVRINIDVLNAQQQLYSTRRDLAKARYETLLAGLKLKAAAGALGEADLAELNALLESR